MSPPEVAHLWNFWRARRFLESRRSKTLMCAALLVDAYQLFVVLSVLLYLQARQRGKVLLSLLAGVSAGLTPWTKGEKRR